MIRSCALLIHVTPQTFDAAVVDRFSSDMASATDALFLQHVQGHFTVLTSLVRSATATGHDVLYALSKRSVSCPRA